MIILISGITYLWICIVVCHPVSTYRRVDNNWSRCWLGKKFIAIVSITQFSFSSLFVFYSIAIVVLVLASTLRYMFLAILYYTILCLKCYVYYHVKNEKSFATLYASINIFYKSAKRFDPKRFIHFFINIHTGIILLLSIQLNVSSQIGLLAHIKNTLWCKFIF